MKIQFSLLLALPVALAVAEESSKPNLEPLMPPPVKVAEPVQAPAVPAPTVTPSVPVAPTEAAAPAAPVVPVGKGGIPFNAENKQIAKKIYAVINEIQRTGFDPQKNFALIAELQRVIAGTSFSNIKEINGYIKASLNLNSLRSRDSKAEQGSTGNQEAVTTKGRGIKVDASLMAGPGLGGYALSADSTKQGGSQTSGVTISSQTTFAELGPATQEQAAAYGKLLEELNAAGFPEPIIASQLYGKWRWHCAAIGAEYEFDLKDDGSLLVEVNSDDPTSSTPVSANKGRGEWKLDYRSLTLGLHGAKMAVFWKQSPQTFLAGKQIKTIDEEEIILDSPQDNLLKRVKRKK